MSKSTELITVAGALVLGLSACAIPQSETGANGPSEPTAAQTADANAGGDTSGEPATEATSEPEGAEQQDATECDQQTAQEAYEGAIDKVPDFDGHGWSEPTDWSTYDSCAGLSWLVLELEGGTGSSPSQVMLFYEGEYVGRMGDNDLRPVENVEAQGENSVKVVWDKPDGPGDEGMEQPAAVFTYDPQTQEFDIERM